ncbi:MAG TPA: MBL fold metallo-hydrolase [Roseimicrobium sp.]|nr:MBL fold metallo-hydrolase [Roseimicrobium sp.]
MKLIRCTSALVIAWMVAFPVSSSLHAQSTSKPAPAKKGQLVMTVLDVPDVQRGAGLAIVLQTPTGKTYLYDTGNGYPSKTNQSGWVADFNMGRDILAPFLKERGIRKLDGVAISHAHYDHFGGLAWMVDNFPIKKLYDSGYTFPGEASIDYTGELGHYTEIRKTFQKRRAYQSAHTGDKLSWDPKLEIEVILPPKEFFSEAHPERRPKADPPAHYLVNANSLGLRIKYGDIVFLLPGDIQTEDQRQSLLPSLPPEKFKCHVLIAPGHGIHSIPEFAGATKPEVTICSVFARYAKGSPAPKVYGKVGSKVYLTGIHGTVTVTSDGKSYEVKVEKEK